MGTLLFKILKRSVFVEQDNVKILQDSVKIVSSVFFCFFFCFCFLFVIMDFVCCYLGREN